MGNTSVFSALKKQWILIKEGKFSYLYLCYFIMACFGGIIPVISVFYTKLIVEGIQSSQSRETLIFRILILSCCCIVCFVLSNLASAYADGMMMSLRQNEFNRCAKMMRNVDYHYIEDPKFQDKIQVGFNALQSDGRGFQKVYKLLGSIFTKGITLVLFFMILAAFDVRMLIVCVVCTILISFIRCKASDYEHSKEEEEAKAARQVYKLNDNCSDFAYGKDIRIFDYKKHLSELIKEKIEKLLEVISDVENMKYKYSLFEIPIFLVQDGYALYRILNGYYSGRFDLSEVTLALSVMTSLSNIIKEFSVDFSSMMTDLKLSCTYFDMIEDNSFYTKDTGKLAFDQIEPIEIEFKNVWFRYPNSEKYILKDFNFKIKAKEKLAIVGTNGAGKTTIIKLLCGLFDCERGQILMNGIDIKEFSKSELYKMFGTVFQDFEIFPCSILENVIGKEKTESSRAKGLDVLYRVGLKEKIEELPFGANTLCVKVVNEEGIDLSGGQKQKIAIARALYKNANVVILDEPTSALDALAEAEIYQSFNDLVENKTAIYISHRLSSTKFCDRIAFFDQDGLKEVGTHEELMALHKGYYHMFKVQGQYYQSEVE